jgi:hypothetical protein
MLKASLVKIVSAHMKEIPQNKVGPPVNQDGIPGI